MLLRSSNSIIRICSFIFLLEFLYLLYLGSKIPIYSDEFEWIFIGSRYFIDYHKLIFSFPACEGFLLDAPVSWYPGVIINSIYYEGGTNQALIRYTGVGNFLLILILSSCILKKNTGFKISESMLVVASFLTTGVLYWIILLNRPEQRLITCVLLCAVISQIKFVRVSLPLLRLFYFVSYCLLSSFIVSTHPKGVFLIPLILLYFWIARKSKLEFIALLLVVGVMVQQTIEFWAERTYCPLSPFLDLRSGYIKFSSLIQDPKYFLKGIELNARYSIVYLNNILYQDTYQSNWLSMSPISSDNLSNSSEIRKLANLLTVAYLIFSLIVIPIAVFYIALRRKAFSYNFFLPCFVFLLVVIICISQNHKNFYESALIFPLLLLALISFPYEKISSIMLRHKKIIISISLLFGITFCGYKIYVFSPQYENWISQSTSSRDPENLLFRASLKQFARESCFIDDKAESLVVDYETYAAFSGSPNIMLISFLTGWWGRGVDYMEVLARRGSSGMIVNCQNIPPNLIYSRKKFHEYCCVSKENLIK